MYTLWKQSRLFPRIILTGVLSLVIALCVGFRPARAATEEQVSTAAQDVAAYLLQQTDDYQVGSIGGDWAILGLARSQYPVPDTVFKKYQSAVENYVRACQGVLHERKYTEYSRVILALTATGYDARNVAGYDLTQPLADYEKTIWQGVNGAIFALLALDSGDYPMATAPAGATQATREMYVAYILEQQLSDGGFSLTGATPADPDVTAMALQALSNYQTVSGVSSGIKKALDCLSTMQDGTGGYASWGAKNCESTAQVILALCQLGISVEDSRFVKNGNTLVDGLLSYYMPGQGFSHSEESQGNDGMATEQAYCALVALERAASGATSFYEMEAVAGSGEYAPSQTVEPVLPAVTNVGKTFADIQNHENQRAIEALAERGVINGMTDSRFAPDETMTRAQFATIMVGAMSVKPQTSTVFRDVAPTAWYAGYIGSAYACGVIQGRSADVFDPEGAITRQEAAVMLTRTAALWGLDTQMNETEITKALGTYADQSQIKDWARASVAYCCQAGLLQRTGTVAPEQAVTRAEIAQMLYNMLTVAGAFGLPATLG